MPRTFVVIRETATVMTDCSDGLFEIEKLVGTLRCGAQTALLAISTTSKNRMKGVLGKYVFDVGDQQFLVLLLMMHTKEEERLDFIEQPFASIREEIVDVRVDRCAIALRFADRRA